MSYYLDNQTLMSLTETELLGLHQTLTAELIALPAGSDSSRRNHDEPRSQYLDDTCSCAVEHSDLRLRVERERGRGDEGDGEQSDLERIAKVLRHTEFR